LPVQELGRGAFGGRELLLGVGDLLAGGGPGRVGDLAGVGADVHPVARAPDIATTVRAVRRLTCMNTVDTVRFTPLALL